MVDIYGTITQYMGTAYTGQGISHKFDKLIATANETVFLKCPPTHIISNVLNKMLADFVKRGYDVDKFMDPIHPDNTQAIFIKSESLLIIQASHPIALEPTDLGGRHKVISFYDIYDEQKLQDKNHLIVEKLALANSNLEKALRTLADAKRLHDEWEVGNINRMQWDVHEKKISTLKEELFGTISLNKNADVSHRLIGSLTSRGAQDFIPSITKNLDRRVLIKGLPGTGKSTLMKALAAEGISRGFDVQYGWCGLDPIGVDLVVFPELSICFIDATLPHVYEPEHPGDEILDLVTMCKEDAEAERKIEDIEKLYKDKILDATGYMQSYAVSENSLIIAMDSAIKQEVFEDKISALKSYSK